jgi:hypothetical protein
MHKIRVVIFSKSEAKVIRAGQVVSPHFAATLFTGVKDGHDETVHDRIARFQRETENCLMQIVEVKDLDGKGSDDVTAPFTHLERPEGGWSTAPIITEPVSVAS